MVPIALLAYALLAWLRPLLALGALLFLIPFGHLARLNLAIPNFGWLARVTIAGVPFTFPEIATYVLVTVLVLQRLFALPLKLPLLGGGEKKKWFLDLWVVFPLLWIIIAAVSAAYSPNELRAWGIWKAYVVAPVLLFWVIRHFSQRTAAPSGTDSGNDKYQNPNFKSNPNGSMLNDQHFSLLTSHFFLPIALGAFIVAAIAILQRFWPIGVPYPWSLPGKFRATSVFGYPNAVGLYLAPLVPLFVGAALSFSWLLRGSDSDRSNLSRGAALRLPRSPAGSLAMTIVFGGAVLVSVLAIALARSTGALVALAAAIPASVIFVRWSWSRRRPRTVARVIIGLWIMISIALTAWLPNQRERTKWGPPIVQKLTFQKWSGSVRLSQYRETWALLRDHPIRGAGLAGYQTAIASYHEKQDVEIFLYPHNLLLAIWVELGLAGLLVFLATMYQLFRIALRLYGSTALRLASVASMLVILVHGLVDVPYFKNDLAMVFWVIAAIAVVSIVDRASVHRVR